MQVRGSRSLDVDFHPKSYECGHSGFYNPADLARYVQAIRIRNCGYFFSEPPKDTRNIKENPWMCVLEPDGTFFSVRQQVQIVQRLKHQKYDIHSWIQRIGRTSVTLAHEFVERDSSTGEEHAVARVTITLVQVSKRTHKPIPIQLKDSISIDHRPDFVTLGPGLSKQIEPPPHAFTTELVVRAQDLDPNNHVTNSAYLDYVEEVRFKAAYYDKYSYWEVSDSRKPRFTASEIARKDCATLNVEYVREGKYGSRMYMATWVMRGSLSQFAFVLFRKLDDKSREVVSRALVTVNMLECERAQSDVWIRHGSKL
eukprot:204478_1